MFPYSLESAMRSLLSFFDESQGKVLVQEKVNTRTQITMADVMTLINNLNEHSGKFISTLQ